MYAAAWHLQLRYAASAFAAIAFLFLVHYTAVVTPSLLPKPPAPDPCTALSGFNLSTLFVALRTGATEAHTKLPAHFGTTLLCLPPTAYAVYSDLAETVAGHAVIDVLADGAISPATKATYAADFAFYDRLHEAGSVAGAFSPDELARWNHVVNSQRGRQDNPAWRLDRWKFVPMAEAALKASGAGVQWFLFTEADTFASPRALLSYLSRFNASAPLYLGREMAAKSLTAVFAYGGAGFVISRPALERLVQVVAADRAGYEDLVGKHWAGDADLGQVLLDSGTRLLEAWPNFESEAPRDVEWGVARNGRVGWCYRALTFHHIGPEELEELFAFEEAWGREHNGSLPRRGDVFKDYILPKLAPERADWDNLSETGVGVSNTSARLDSFEKCRTVCERVKDCLQFSFSGESCKISFGVKLGHQIDAAAAPVKVRSGWMMDRMEGFVRRMDAMCKSEDWVLA